MNTNPVQWETIDALINATAEDENLSFTWLDDLATHQLELVAYAISEEMQAVYSELERVQVLYLLSVIWKALEGKLKAEPLIRRPWNPWMKPTGCGTKRRKMR